MNEIVGSFRQAVVESRGALSRHVQHAENFGGRACAG